MAQDGKWNIREGQAQLVEVSRSKASVVCRLSRVLIAVALALTSACSTIRQGGAPDPSFDLDGDIAQLAIHFQPATNIKVFYQSPSKDARDRIIVGRLVLIDLRYLQFIRTLSADKQHLDSAADILTLSLNLIATVTGGAIAKANLSALSAGVTGTKVTIDKHYYFEKSVPALVSTMNARRKEVLTRILEGLKNPLERYSFEQGLSDLTEYYLAGTLNGALQAIQTSAAEREKLSDSQIKRIQKLTPYTVRQIDVTEELTRSLIGKELTLPRANAALRALGMEEDKLPKTIEVAREELRDFIDKSTPSTVERLREIFVKTEILK